MEVPRLDVFETGNEPDYYITDILRIEPANDHDVRLYLGSKMNSLLKLQYSVVISRNALRPMAQQLIEMADELDASANVFRFRRPPR